MRKRTEFSLVSITIFTIIRLTGVTLSVADEEAWEELIKKATREGRYGQALDYLSRLEIKRPNDPALQAAKVQLLTQLGHQLYREKKYSRARDILLDALDLNSDNYAALVTLGEIAYYTQRLEEAEGYWTKALGLKPGDQQIINLLKRIEKERAVEGELDFSSLANFDIRFHAETPAYDIYDIQGYLLDAYREIGCDFNLYPSRSLVVILYTREEFEHLRTTPQWVGGIYDGKIRLPVGQGEPSASDFKKILWHEYTHALIHDLAGNNCPIWLHEGLAQYEEAKVEPINNRPLQQAWEKDGPLKLSTLDKFFAFSQSPEKVNLAYAQAYSLAGYLIRKYGFWRVNQLLQRVGKEGSWLAALEGELSLTLSELEKEWQRNLEGEF